MSNTNTAVLDKPTKTDRGGKFLTFALGREEYGLEILKVREIIGLMDITAVPRTPSYVKGVINLRGQVITVVDLRAKFDMPSTEKTDQTCIIVVEIQNAGRKLNTGIIVDRVSEVQDIPAAKIEDAPSLGSEEDQDFILGMGKIGESVKILLDINKVLSTSDVVKLNESAK
ncbi:MAG TPA: chemotaxis protein CheW [Tepidisphaeraceae bacterium]